MGYTTPIPSELLTPDTVQTSIGTFNFFDGMPDPATVRKTFENLKFPKYIVPSIQNELILR